MTTDAPPLSTQPDESMEYKNYYGICWVGTTTDNLRYAKNMDYRHIVNWVDMRNEADATDIGFYLENPTSSGYWPLFADWAVREGKEYSAEERSNLEGYFAWKSDDPFPDNLATGWFYSDTEFSPQPDFQQQRVIDYFVDSFIKVARNTESEENGYVFKGTTWDVPNLTGDFWMPYYDTHIPTTLSHWTGADSCLLHEGISHEYATYSEGMTAMLVQLKRRLSEAFPDRDVKCIWEPFDLYKDWIAPISALADGASLMPDLLFAEGTGTDFVDDGRIFSSGLISRDRVGSSARVDCSLSGNMEIAAKAAINGAWFTWFGLFVEGRGDIAIRDIPVWAKLIRVVPNWDNLAGVPLDQRSWDGRVYQSPNSYFDDHVIAARNPYSGKLFIVFLDGEGSYGLRDGENLVEVNRIDSLFGAADDGMDDIVVSGGRVALR